MKAKSVKSISKRFERTKGGKGKIVRQKAGHRHRLIPKTKERKIECRKKQGVSIGDAHRINNLI